MRSGERHQSRGAPRVQHRRSRRDLVRRTRQPDEQRVPARELRRQRVAAPGGRGGVRPRVRRSARAAERPGARDRRRPAARPLRDPRRQPGLVGRQARRAEALAELHERALEAAARLDCRTVAFPAIGCGAHGFPSEVAAGIVLPAVEEALDRLPASSGSSSSSRAGWCCSTSPRAATCASRPSSSRCCATRSSSSSAPGHDPELERRLSLVVDAGATARDPRARPAAARGARRRQHRRRRGLRPRGEAGTRTLPDVATKAPCGACSPASSGP